MAEIQDVVRTITIRGKSDGVDRLAEDLKKLSDAQGNVAVVTDRAAKSTVSTDQAFAKLESRMVSSIGNQQKYQSVVDQVRLAVANNTTLQERGNVVIAEAAQKYGQVSPLAKAFGGALSGVQGQLVALSAGAGPVGVFLSALGPWGIAAAVVLGGLGAAFHYVAEESLRMGEKAIELQHFKEITGLTIDEILSLRKAGADFGVTGDVIATSFERMTAQLTEARRASGPLFDNLQRVDGALAKQIVGARDTSSAITILAKAYQAAGDESQKATLARALFGRGGAALGPVLGQIADSGGLQDMSAKTKELTGVTDQQIEHWARMRAQIEELNNRAKNILASIFTEDGLAAELKAAELAERMARATRELSSQTKDVPWWARLGLGAEGGMSLSSLPAATPISLPMPQIPGITVPEYLTAQKQDAARKSAQDAAAADAKLTRDRIALLGAAAGPEEQRIARLKDLKSALLDNKMSQEDYNRAVAGQNLETAITTTSAYVSALGPLATIQDQVRLKTLELAQANLHGAGLTRDQVSAVINLARATAEWSKANEFASVGMFNIGVAATASKDQLRAWIDQKLLDPSNAQAMATALGVLAARTEALKDAAFNATPALRALHDAQFEKSTMFMSDADKAAATSARGISQSDWVSHLNDAGPAAARLNSELSQTRDLGKSFLSSFNQDIVNGTLNMNSLTNAVKGFETKLLDVAETNVINGLFKTQAAGGGGILGGFAKLFGFSSGGVMSSAGPLPLRMYTSGGVARSPQMAIYSEYSQPEAYVPLPDGRSIPVNINMPTGRSLGGDGVFAPTQNITIGSGNNVTIEQVRQAIATSNSGLYRQIKRDFPAWSAARQSSEG